MSDIDDIKSRLNIADIIGARVKLKKAGHNFKGLCPFHNEKTPSFIVSPERQIFHCFGCGKGGSIFDFVMEYEHIDFIEALEMLAEKAGVKLERRLEVTPEGKLKQKLFEVNHLASEYYHYLLTKHALGEKARAYLKSRAISDKSVETFTLGYSPNSWESLSIYLRKKGYDAKLLATAGLLIPSAKGGYDRFRGRLMFTLKDHRGNVVGFAGRSLDKHAKEAKYINTSETPVYIKSNVLYGLDVTKGAIQKANDAVIMEGELDVISSFQAGVGNVVAIKGSALTEGHVGLLRRFTERITFALDSDMAGDSASRRGIEIADKAGLDMNVVVLPFGKDPDDVARENPVLLKKAIKDAVSIYDYFFSSARKRFDITTAFGKRKMSEELIPIIAKIENPIVAGHYSKKLATELDISEEVVSEGMRKAQRQGSFGTKSQTAEEKRSKKTHEETVETYILALLLQGKTADLYEDFTETVNMEDFSYPPVRTIIEKLGTYLKDIRIFLLTDFANSLPQELIPTLDEAFLWDVAGLLDSEEHYMKEWTRTLQEFRRSVLRKKIKAITSSMSEENGESEATSLHDRLKAFTTELAVLEKSGAV